MVLLRGVELQLHPTPELFSDAIRNKSDFYEADILDYLRDNYKEQRTIIDVGAMIGNHTAYFATFLRYDKIIAFEPYAFNYTLLIENTEIFKKVKLVPYALSNISAVLNFAPNYGNMGAGEINDEGDRRVFADTLDSFWYLWDAPVTLIKIDAEKHEPQVIEGARKTIERYHPLILIEDSERMYNEILEPLGYKMVNAWPHHRTYLWKYND